jgi:hypothetical protein
MMELLRARETSFRAGGAYDSAELVPATGRRRVNPALSNDSQRAPTGVIRDPAGLRTVIFVKNIVDCAIFYPSFGW